MSEIEQFLPALRQREVQMIGAALSTRNWHGVEVAYNQLRDKIDAQLRTPTLNETPDYFKAGAEVSSFVQSEADLVTRLRAIDEEAMYQEPATTFATVQEAAAVIERQRRELYAPLRSAQHALDIIYRETKHRLAEEESARIEDLFVEMGL